MATFASSAVERFLKAFRVVSSSEGEAVLCRMRVTLLSRSGKPPRQALSFPSRVASSSASKNAVEHENGDLPECYWWKEVNVKEDGTSRLY